MLNKKFAIRPVLRVFWTHVARYPATTIVTLIFTAAVFGIEVVVPLYYKRLFDAIGSSPTPSFSTAQLLILILLSVLGLQFVGWLVRRVGQFANVYFQARIMHDLTQTAFGRLLGHSYGFFVNTFAGSLVRKINRLPRAFEQFADRMVYEILPLIVSLAGILAVLFWRHVWLGLVFVIWIITLITLQFFIARWKLKYNLLVAEKDSETTGVLADAISNDVTIKLFTGEAHERLLFGDVSTELRDLRLRSWRFDEWVNLIQGLLMIGIEFVLMYVGIKLWAVGTITIGDFALIQAYLVSAIAKLWNFGNVLRRIYEAFADAAEMVDIIDAPIEITDAPRASALGVTSGQIEFREVHFNFRETRPVLQNFNLQIASHEKVALVGPSGAGKTTVAKLLFRFYDVTAGGIYIDGQNIASATQASLRQAIALVPQEPILFHRTLMENIRYGRREATDEEVISAARQAHCYEFISQCPEGFATHVGERGVKLSGGERQRVAIARAILKNAPILVLDEATSSLDSESEALIQEALSRLMRGKTVIVIAHRLSTIMQMDRIVVIENGQVATTGSHQELLARDGGLYKKLWEIQAGGFLPA